MCTDIIEEKIKFSCNGIQEDGNNINYQKNHNVLFNKHNDQVWNHGFGYINGYMKVMTKNKKGLNN